MARNTQLQTPDFTRQFLRTVRPLHAINRLLVLEPFSIDLKAPKLVTSCSQMAFMILFLLLQLYIDATQTYKQFILAHISTAFEMIQNLSHVGFIVLYLATTVVDLLGNRERLDKIVHILQYCDTHLAVDSSPLITKTRLVVSVELVLIFCFTGLLIWQMVVEVKIIGTVLEIIGLLRICCCGLRFVNLTLLLRSMIRTVKDQLARFCREPWESSEAEMGQVWCASQDDADAAGAILKLRRVTWALRDMSHLTVDAHRCFMLFVLAFAMGYCICILYAITQTPMVRANDWYLLGFSAMLCGLLGLPLTLVLPAHVAASEVDATRQVVARLLADRRLGQRAGTELELFADQLTLCPPSFTLLGPIKLDLHLLLSSLSFLTTYCVVLATLT